MKINFTVRKLLYATGALMLLASQAVSALGQCAMCKATLQASASANPQAASDIFNLAVLVLLIPPVLLFAGFFIVLLRYRRGGDESAANPLKPAGAFD
jgi:F0F1-type ATP synthase membrane subunit c/vacuolar-type H+-ATPase subunit K